MKKDVPVSTPARVPDPTVAIPAEDLATLEGEQRRLFTLAARVAEGSQLDRNAPRQAGRIRGAINNLRTAIKDGLKVWRQPPPDGQPLPDSPPLVTTGTTGNLGKSATALECARMPQDATGRETGNGPAETPRRRQPSGLHGAAADTRRALPKP
jgi:hypothetical protein